MTKPLVAIVFDEDGNVDVRASGDVTIVWVDERQPHDRVFETTQREPLDELLEFIGPRDGWGSSGDERQKRLYIQMANLRRPALELVSDNTNSTLPLTTAPSPASQPSGK